MTVISKDMLDRIVAVAAEQLGASPSGFFVADHNHEGLREGAYSIAFEGWSDFDGNDWPNLVASRQHGPDSPFPAGVFLEPRNSWCLAVYPDAS